MPAGEPDQHTRLATFSCAAGSFTIGDTWRDLESSDRVNSLLAMLLNGLPVHDHVGQVIHMLTEGVPSEDIWTAIKERDIPSACSCDADHQMPSSVIREYFNKDGEDSGTSVFGHGHYTSTGIFEPDEEVDLSGGRYDTADGCDTCANCGGIVG